MSASSREPGPSQRERVDEALARAEEHEVNVWGPPEELRGGERVCTTQRPSHGITWVVYHPRAVLRPGGEYACPSCGGATTPVPDGHA